VIPNRAFRWNVASVKPAVCSNTAPQKRAPLRNYASVNSTPLQAGIVHVNDQPVGDEPQMPFGGQAAVDEFTEVKWMTVQSGTRPFPF
jgi:hypothetical protein